jgi:hypothetical protein
MIDFTEMGAQRLSGLGNGAACHQELRGSSAAGLDIVFEFIPGFMWGDLQKICGLKLVFVSCYLLPAECTCANKGAERRCSGHSCHGVVCTLRLGNVSHATKESFYSLGPFLTDPSNERGEH